MKAIHMKTGVKLTPETSHILHKRQTVSNVVEMYFISGCVMATSPT